MKPPSFIVSILEQKNNERNTEQMREIDALRDFHRKDKKEYRVFIESQNLWRFDGILEIITIFAMQSILLQPVTIRPGTFHHQGRKSIKRGSEKVEKAFKL